MAQLRVVWHLLGLILGLAGLVSASGSDSSPIFAEYARQANASLLWGPYRSNLYFGVRPRGLPHSLMAGLMWFNSTTYDGIDHFRHGCHEFDDNQGFGWQSYDPRTGGVQVIRDNKNELELHTEFVKTESGSWAVRVKGMPKSPDQVTTIAFYTSLEGPGALDLETKLTLAGIPGDIKLKGTSPELHDFLIDISAAKSNRSPASTGTEEEGRKPAENWHYASLTIPDDNTWLARDIFLTFVQDNINTLSQRVNDPMSLPAWTVFMLENRSDVKGKMHFVEKVFQGDFEFDVMFNPAALSKEERITSKNLASFVETSLNSMDSKFKDAFTFHAPFDTPEHELFAKEFLSSLIGGIGYFHGTSLVDRTAGSLLDEDEDYFYDASGLTHKTGNPQEEGPYDLLTAVPSRPFFPRGFYWDEGFHLIPILDFDADLTLEILKSWMNLIDDDGWIAREQILGKEARSKVPADFQVQYPNYANPPTLMLLFSDIVKKSQDWVQPENPKFFEMGFELGSAHIQHPELLLNYAESIYPKLQKHYEWFRRTQRGQIREWDRESFSPREGYMWQGRTPNHCLTSGLDDYPRAPLPHEGELHVDLLCWIGMMTRSLKDVATVLGKEEDVEEYTTIENAISRNLDDLHWNDELNMYCDATVDDYEESVHVCHKGYVSLMPFLLKLIKPESDHLKFHVDDVMDPKGLWTPYGIRSLAKTDEYFGTEENYWRGPIWINMNYMILEALQYYGTHAQTAPEVRVKCAQAYKELRVNIVSNVYKNWERTGYAWEQYDSNTGKGQGFHNFLGWTSLVVKMMAMPETLE